MEVPLDSKKKEEETDIEQQAESKKNRDRFQFTSYVNRTIT